MRVMRRKHITKTSPAQRDSEISIFGRLSGVLCWPHGQNCPTQQDSGISKLGLTPRPLRPLRLNLLSAQQDSKMSNGRLSGLLCWPHDGRRSETSPAQRVSGISNLGILGILRSLGILGSKTVRQGVRMKTEKHKDRIRPAQRGSGISSLADGRTSLTSPTEPQCAPAQQGSKNSNLDLSLCLCVSVVKAAWRAKGKNRDIFI